MNIDTIITLSDNSKYWLLDKTSIEDKTYFYAVAVKDDLSSVYKEFIFIEELKKDGKIFIKKVEDQEVKDFLLTIFTKEYVESIEDLESNE